MRKTRKESQQITRERLRNSARTHFARRGVTGAAIEQIAQDAGLTRGAFYANYKDKLELIVDLLEKWQLSEMRLWNELLQSSDDPSVIGTVVAKTEDMVKTLERTMISVELQLEAERNPDFTEKFKEHIDKIYDGLREMIVTLLTSNGKSIPGEIDTFVVLIYQFGLYLGSKSILGNKISKHHSPSDIMVNFLKYIIKTSPDI